ncbi:MAG: hypothetical protein M5U14_09640 [Acidimicrobiia bacterium]|nr:hypothetical protein [Acidimicrobiia bacterium]
MIDETISARSGRPARSARTASTASATASRTATRSGSCDSSNAAVCASPHLDQTRFEPVELAVRKIGEPFEGRERLGLQQTEPAKQSEHLGIHRTLQGRGRLG